MSEGVNRLDPQSADRGNFSQWLELLSTEEGAWRQVICNEEASRILRKSELDQLIELIDVLPPGLIASEQTGLYEERIVTILKAFYASLSSGAAASTQLDLLSSLDQREEVRKGVAEALAEAYAKVSTYEYLLRLHISFYVLLYIMCYNLFLLPLYTHFVRSIAW